MLEAYKLRSDTRIMEIRENLPLAPLTTLHVGGPARYFAEAEHEDDVREGLRFAQSRNLPLFVLGGGSNLVISDRGWPGLVLRIGISGITSDVKEGIPSITAGAGLNWDSVVAEAVERNWAGIECLSGIPGSVGGTPVQNVGAYGQEVSETIESVRAFDLKSGEIVELTNTECGFSYRASIFNTTARGRYIILSVCFRLTSDGPPKLKYADLQRHFSDRDTPPTLAQVRNAVREIRHSKGMLIVPGDENSRSAGSFFKNPVLSEEQFAELTRRAASHSLKIPSYPALQAQHKVSAAWLVENSGFSKGFKLGEAAISGKHALALINPGNASATDVVKLKEHIQQRVDRMWGIQLDPEPVFVGF